MRFVGLRVGIKDYRFIIMKKINNIGVCAPADYIDKNKYLSAKKIFKKNFGITLVPGNNLFNRYGCFAGVDEERIDDINNFIADDSIDGIIFAKGGYGSAALLDKINYEYLKKNPKFFMGYSDTTSLLIALNSISNAPSYYGAMITTEFFKPLNKLTELFFKNIVLKNNTFEITEKESAKFNFIKLVSKKFSGIVTGGCLTIFNTLIGTPYLKIPDDAILFLEDTNEETYRIDRQITHIKNSGILSKCKALILDFKNYKPTSKNKETIPLNKRLLETLSEYPINIIRWDCFGHRNKKVILPIGKKITFDFEKADNKKLII